MPKKLAGTNGAGTKVANPSSIVPIAELHCDGTACCVSPEKGSSMSDMMAVMILKMGIHTVPVFDEMTPANHCHDDDTAEMTSWNHMHSNLGSMTTHNGC